MAGCSEPAENLCDLVGAVSVVEALVLAEGAHQVWGVPYECAVGEFGAEAVEEAIR